MKIQPRTDTSFLFSNLNRNNNSGISAMTGLLGDYASIKNGSYGKLMRAYFSTNAGEEVTKLAKSSSKTADTDVKSIAKVQEAATDLKKTTATLTAEGEDSIYTKSMEDIYSAVKSYVADYNATLEAGEDADNSMVSSRVETLTKNTAMYEKDLAAIGITINKDNSLSVDKDTFLKAKATDVQSVFQGRGSLGQVNSAQADLIKMAADYEAARSGTYTFDATFSTTGLSGNIFDTML